MKLSKWIGWGVLLMALVGAGTAFAQGVATGRSANGSLLAYHAAGLPDPIVVYVYDKGGMLLRVFGENGDNGFAARGKFMAIVRSGAITRDATANKAVSQSFVGFLQDSGIDFHKVVDSDKPYSLVLVVPDTQGQPCPPCQDYQKAMASAVQAPAAHDKYAIFTLALGAPNVKFQVAQ